MDDVDVLLVLIDGEDEGDGDGDDEDRVIELSVVDEEVGETDEATDATGVCAVCDQHPAIASRAAPLTKMVATVPRRRWERVAFRSGRP